MKVWVQNAIRTQKKITCKTRNMTELIENTSFKGFQIGLYDNIIFFFLLG